MVFKYKHCDDVEGGCKQVISTENVRFKIGRLGLKLMKSRLKDYNTPGRVYRQLYVACKMLACAKRRENNVKQESKNKNKIKGL